MSTPAAHPIYVSEAESVALMMRSGYQPDGTFRGLQMHFGPGWAALDESAPDFEWAATQLAELRGITPSPAPTTAAGEL